jgi:hypothetical protein
MKLSVTAMALLVGLMIPAGAVLRAANTPRVLA